MGHRPRRDYVSSTKIGVATGSALFLLGEIGQFGAPRIQGTVPDWEASLFAWCSIGGILLVIVSVFLFGVALPLIE